ncbi:cryptococcal mannosyltransferase 1-domain-containing protein [Mycena rosella]|uniref:Cryptococcal mannosyltransferase 1-domain-containing protein n=1 Tax=Mycena rosella TaxID=1033263 RepID=A0AAD7FJ19_MYCRO|nr:cryptococcal mannosyltransferase 1-domain-containing protein [Mycena rosella]
MKDGWRRTISSAIALLFRRLSFTVLLILRTAFVTLPIFLFWYIYDYAYGYWMLQFPPESGLFGPAWPPSRTRLVILMAVIPAWGASMAVGMVLWSLFKYLFARGMRRRPGGEDYEAAIPRENTRESTLRVHRLCSRSLGCSYLVFGCFSICVAMAISGVYMYKTYELPGDHRYRPDVVAALEAPRPTGYYNGTKVFIAVLFNNNIDILPHWIEEFTKVIHYLGTANVFISVVESNSWDGTAEMLDEWKGTLDGMGVAHLIHTRDHVVPRPSDRDRIDFLSAARNLALAPLVEKGGYDVVLFSNDILIKAESVVELLKTNNGEWDMVCGLDVGRWGLYDVWVVRDRLGRLVSSLWPYFLEDAGIQAVMEDEPAPVFTCWNGIVAFRADPVLPIHLRKPGRLSTSPLPRPLSNTHPAYPQPASLTPALTPPLAFRPSTAKECISSESFNFPYDLRRQFDMQRIFLNPRVINAYEWRYFVWYKYITRHWVVVWWMKNVEVGNGMQFAKMVIGDAKRVWTWDGGECHPWI